MTASSTKKTSNRVYAGLSESERVQERRERFLEAGLEIFGHQGIRGATVRKLCREAGLTERYFYESFSDTEDLYCAVYNVQMNALAQRFLAALPSLPEPLEERIRACLQLYFSLMRDDRMVRVLYIECMAGTERVNEILTNIVRVQSTLAVNMMKQDNPDLELPDELIESIAAAINGATSSVVIQWMLGGYKIPEETLVESCTLVVLGTMRELKASYGIET